MGDVFSYELLPMIFNMTVTASVVILVVLLARFLLKKLGAPAVVSYALWAVVLFRLLCPVSFTAPFSLLRVLDSPAVTTESGATTIEYVPREIVHMEHPAVELPIPVVGEAINAALPQGEEQLRADPLEGPMFLLTMLWLCGLLVLVLYSVVSYVRLRMKLVGAVSLEDNIRLADHITSPFVMGLFRPKIYLPSSLSESEREYIILHERHHIRRLDHIVKILAFAALCVHWFNPLVWLAFYLSGKDMEMSCDEAVVKKLGTDIRADYSASLLKLSTGRTVIAATPLAFGEGDTGSRIKNLAKWKKPAVYITVVAVILCAAVILLCAANAKDLGEGTADGSGTEQQTERPPRQFGPDRAYVSEKCLYLAPYSSYYPAGGNSGYRYRMGDGGFSMTWQATGVETTLAEGYGWAKWEQFPWSDKEWNALFWPDGMRAVDISGYEKREYCPLSQEYCLLRMDGELWLVQLNLNEQMGAHVHDIYTLVPEAAKGSAQWEFAPMLSSREPWFRFEFDMEYDEISAACSETPLMDVDGEKGSDHALMFPAGHAVYWSPVDGVQSPAAESTIHFTARKDGKNLCWGTVYIRGTRIEDSGTMLYTATLVGTGLVMEQNPDGGAVIRLK